MLKRLNALRSTGMELSLYTSVYWIKKPKNKLYMNPLCTCKRNVLWNKIKFIHKNQPSK